MLGRHRTLAAGIQRAFDDAGLDPAAVLRGAHR
jgi:hypothetical protein